MKEPVLAPGETYNGVLFFEVHVPELYKDRDFRVLSAFPLVTLKVYTAVTNIETQERVHFGPFGLYR